jgi:hypothetical protein
MDNLCAQSKVNILPYIDSARALYDSVDWCKPYRHRLKPLSLLFPCDTNSDTIFVLENASIPDQYGVVLLSYWSKKHMYSVLMKEDWDTITYVDKNKQIFDHWLMTQIEMWNKDSLVQVAGTRNIWGKSIFYATRIIFYLGEVSVDAFSFEQLFHYPVDNDEREYLYKLWYKRKRRFLWW